MCGIALIIYGIRFDLSSLLLDTTPPVTNSDQLEFSIGDLGAALRRRGPDSLGSKKLLLHSSDSDCEVVSSIGGLEEESNCECKSNCFSAANGRTPHLQCTCTIPSSSGQLHFLGATLQLRGVNPLVQPLIDSSKNILVYNGEIFGGIDTASDENDGEVLMRLLGGCKGSVPNVLSRIKGPWAIIYWQVTLSGKFKKTMVWPRCIWSQESSCSLADTGGLSVAVIVSITCCFK